MSNPPVFLFESAISSETAQVWRNKNRTSQDTFYSLTASFLVNSLTFNEDQRRRQGSPQFRGKHLEADYMSVRGQRCLRVHIKTENLDRIIVLQPNETRGTGQPTHQSVDQDILAFVRNTDTGRGVPLNQILKEFGDEHHSRIVQLTVTEKLVETGFDKFSSA